MKHTKEDYQFIALSDKMRVLTSVLHETGCHVSHKWDANDLTNPDHYGPLVYGSTDYRQRDRERCQKAIDSLCATLAYQSFNAKDGWKIAEAFEPFYRLLPVSECKDDNNPNNGTAIWDVELPNDSTILLTTTRYYFQSELNKAEIERVVKDFGHSVKADEMSVECEQRETPLNKITDWRIRLWWD